MGTQDIFNALRDSQQGLPVPRAGVEVYVGTYHDDEAYDMPFVGPLAPRQNWVTSGDPRNPKPRRDYYDVNVGCLYSPVYLVFRYAGAPNTIRVNVNDTDYQTDDEGALVIPVAVPSQVRWRIDPPKAGLVGVWTTLHLHPTSTGVEGTRIRCQTAVCTVQWAFSPFPFFL